MREEEGVLGDVPNTALGPRRLLMQTLLVGHVILWPLLPNRSAFWVVAMAPAEHHHVPQTSWPIEVPVRDEQKRQTSSHRHEGASKTFGQKNTMINMLRENELGYQVQGGLGAGRSVRKLLQ